MLYFKSSIIKHTYIMADLNRVVPVRRKIVERIKTYRYMSVR
ncbi:hypothetical protein qdsa001_60 [Staphylococcus phage qdsa001]|nr:hypothetical protein qdsa001_60 [Staphylococcus phage qdsa001]